MQGRKRYEKSVAVILDDINSSFSTDIIKGITKAIPEKKNISLFVISGKYADEKNHRYKAVYNSIYRLGQQCIFDGIIHIGDMNRTVTGADLSEKPGTVPEVFVASNAQNRTNVNYDSEKGISQAVEYLVNINGFSKICMLGGREDNRDAFVRKKIFTECLKKNGVYFSDMNYEITDMSSECAREAARLLDRNPGVQAIFCVNDSVARGLYRAMEEKNLVPGKDILVFGFDNTRAAGEMSPTLTSIGADESSLGQKAMELMLRRLDGETVSSALVPTRLYGRESFHYERYDYSIIELMNADPKFIHRMFRDCFYRYRREPFDRESVDLERLFYEFVSLMLKAMQRKYISIEEYNRIVKMINKFFEKGAAQYTDTGKLIESMEKLQSGINHSQKSAAVNAMVNSLFTKMKDKVIGVLSDNIIQEKNNHLYGREQLLEFLIDGAFDESKGYDGIFTSINKLGLKNAAFYMFEKPFEYGNSDSAYFPDTIMLKCIVKDGDAYTLPEERQVCMTRDIFLRDELTSKSKVWLTFPVLYTDTIYGFLVCGAADEIYKRGEFLSLQLGRAIYIKDLQNRL
ncbi:MAG: LacI family DNA-binding transcriptional regulator [Ruminococcus sp.]|nr:LacI family DNA-binding transcriptional regulator [Ruminococcus sp.]